MTNFNINFVNAWWLLLLIPAFGLTLFSYFRLHKRYRCTRNRIVSMVLHLVIMVLSVALLAGVTAEYDVPNTETEVIILVDSSFTMDDSDAEADGFIKDVINKCDSMYKLGIVKFGYDQVYAVEMTKDMDKVYSTYLASPNPDTTATDLASALNFAASLFSNPRAARIVLLSDALETDGEARDLARAFAIKGIAIDTVYFPGKNAASTEVQIVSADKSVSKVELNTTFNMELTVNSAAPVTATITPYDNNTPGKEVSVNLKGGLQTVSIPYSFAWGGMHVMSFEIKAADDVLMQNNVYYSYVYIDEFTEVLVIESRSGESEQLKNALNEALNTTVVKVGSPDMPTTVEELREFDEVILLNVSNNDLPDGFDVILKDYVQNVGGGLFTVCGNKEGTGSDWTANAYTRKDMYNTIYQEMLPVEIIDYTAPVGVIIVIDSSGSMTGSKYEDSKFSWALDGARNALNALTERDYVGVMTLANSYTEELTLTPRTQRDKILESISDLEYAAKNGTLVSGGTLFSPAFERAGKALGARSDIEKKHIIVVTDGEPNKDDEVSYRYWAQENAKLGITMSIIGIGMGDNAETLMRELLVDYAGCSEKNLHNITSGSFETLPDIMKSELEGPEIKSVNYETFTPEIGVLNSITNNIPANEMPTLDGYYGVKLKPKATAVLLGKYTPIYSQWEYGKGRVGTFACDLNGTWSAEFLASEVGVNIINSIVTSLFPSENIRVPDITASLKGENYTNTLSIFTNLGTTEKLKVSVTSQFSGIEQVYNLDYNTEFTRLTFPTKEPGLHTVHIEKLDSDGNVISDTTLYRTLSYSKEYDEFVDRAAAKKLIEHLATESGGTVVSESSQVFDNAVKLLHKVIDPRIAFAIIIIVCFLLDIAARKFKWKWPHEIIREKKMLEEKKEGGAQ